MHYEVFLAHVGWIMSEQNPFQPLVVLVLVRGRSGVAMKFTAGLLDDVAAAVNRYNEVSHPSADFRTPCWGG